VGAALALASALSYGLSDVVGGLAARRLRAVRVALLGQLGGLVAVAVAVPFVTPALPAVRDVLWGGLSGVGTGLAMALLFRGMSRGAMSVVVPVSAVGGVALPVLVGSTVFGDRPPLLAWAGVVLALPALWLVSRGSAPPTHAAIRDGLGAGAGIAVQYLALAQTGSGLWPVLAGRVTAVAAVVIVAATLMRHGTPPRPPARWARLAAGGAGVLAAVALAAYQSATQTELVTIAVVLSSLYPVVPVLVGIAALNERVSWQQVAGMAAALTAAALIAAA
jgi:drug/metabolite transporter (DMT)-like permease